MRPLLIGFAVWCIAADFDAVDADCILQLGIFGSVIYG